MWGTLRHIDCIDQMKLAIMTLLISKKSLSFLSPSQQLVSHTVKCILFSVYFSL